MKTTILLSGFLYGAVLYSQMQTGQIGGTVKDSSGAVIPEAAIAVRNLDTGVTRASATNGLGNYAIPLLDAGQYRLTVTKDGFRTASHDGIVLHVADNVRLDFVLELGSVAETMEIHGQASLVQSESAAMGTVVENRQIVNLPLNSRNPFTLTLLTPGVIPSAQYGDEFNNSNAFRINGGRSNMSEILIDGVTNSVPGANQFLVNAVFPSVDALEEFKVLTNTFSAEYGRTGGGVVNMILKSGTNSVHGSVYEFLRNSRLDANNFFSNRSGGKLPSFQRNQFGATLGGPVIKNKAFFFASYESLRQRSGGFFSTTVPTALERRGDFSRSSDLVAGVCTPLQIFDPVTTRRNPAGTGFVRDLFPNNTIPASRLDPVGSRTVQYYPAPTSAGNACNGVNNFTAQQKNPLNTLQVDSRLDWMASSKDKLFGSVSWRERDAYTPNYYGNLAYGSGTNGDFTPGRGLRLDYTRIQSPSLLFNLRFGISRMTRTTPSTAPADWQVTELGFPKFLQDEMQRPFAFPNTTIAGFGSFGGTFAKVDQTFTTYSWYANGTKMHGRHTFKFGTEVRVNQVYAENLDSTQMNLSFSRGFTQGPDPNAPRADRGSGVASLLTGLGTGLIKLKPGVLTSNNYYGLFLQDDIRVSGRLTLNLGIRYDLENGRDERFNRLSWFDFTAPSPLAAKVPQFPNLRGGLRFVGVDADRQFDLDPNNFAPRIGLAYAIQPKLILRTGYGIYYMSYLGAATGDAAAVNGYLATTSWVSSLDGVTPVNYLSNPFPTGLAKPKGSSEGMLSSLGQALGVAGQVYGGDGAIDRTSRVAYQQNWNFNLQYEAWGTAFEAAYTGSKGTKLLDQGWEMNQLTTAQLAQGSALQTLAPNPFFGLVEQGPLASPTVSRAQLMMPYPQFVNVYDFRPGAASSIYHAFQLNVNKRTRHGFTLLLGYTAGKLIDDSSGIGPAGPSPLHEDSYNRRASRSVSPQDVSQRMVVSYIYEIPFGRGKPLGASLPRWLNALAGNWQINGITTFSKGLPLVLSAPNNNNSGSSVQRPNVNGDPRLSGDRSTDEKLARWFNISAFSQPAAFTFGNTGRVLPSVRAAGIKNYDFSLFKQFTWKERHRVEFRAESFNLMNTPQFGTPGQSFGSGQFGVISAQANAPRQVQFGLKVVY